MPHPNIVMVVLDTTRADALSSYGNPKPTTPRIDAIASQGVRFERAFSTDFWTLPAHASLLTGEYPTPLGATSETNRLSEEATTLAERLRGAGYRTAAFVSNAWVSRERGFAQGFDHYEEMWRRKGLRGEGYMQDRVAIDEAIAFIRRVGRPMDAGSDGAPFFAFLNLNSAHLPYSPSPEAFVELTPQARPLERTARLKKVKGMWSHLGGQTSFDVLDYQILRELYDAEVSMLDVLIGRLDDALREGGLHEGTIVVITADHGENIGEHGMIDHLLSMYETTIRVPLIIRYPGRIEAGSVRNDLVSIVDVAPTLLTMAGVRAGEPPLPGRSVFSEQGNARRFVTAENDRPVNGIELMKSSFPEFDVTQIDRRMRMLRTPRHKLIWHSDGSVELYDLDADPDERVDLSKSEPLLRDRLVAQLEAWMQSQGEVVESERFESGDEAGLEQLRALGYIE